MNGLDEVQSLKLSAEENFEALASDVIDRLCLPLVCGKHWAVDLSRPFARWRFGIKGTFTAAVWHNW
jgi:hypothetical protein